jgi:hypothetical protein
MNRSEFEQAKLFIFSDIRREIELAKVSARGPGRRSLERLGVLPGGGNFLAALGLLCYTEFGGKLLFGRRKASANFNAFFDSLGPGYAALRANHKVYDILRCGLAHEYYAKHGCSIVMKSRSAGPGVRVDSRGHFVFIVERYTRDLRKAFDAAGRQLFGS